ncbi:AbiJ-NTD4 domain-containing protein [Pseudidiomarina gelatinasegens]|uniref:AbiJ-NTD4 domain-containing protein n=1 Tax=Pseudidiomarina gelatinasegens TaxID=2487740 RepID=UPI003A976539
MLTDIFAYRYLDSPIWDSFDENARRLLVQGFRIVAEQLFPYYHANGNEKSEARAIWGGLNKKLAMELGLKDLSSPIYGYYSDWNGNKHWVSGSWPKITVCENFVLAEYDGSVTADQFVKERLSFIELAFRQREEKLSELNASLDKRVQQAELEAKMKPARGLRLPGSPGDTLRAWNQTQNELFRASCNELNERFRRSRVKLHYHNGFIQISEDEAVLRQIEQPFWNLVGDPMWQSVDHDMKEAIDLRDSGGRDPALFAAKALESAIKIISDVNGWTRGTEKGAANYIDNLRAKANGEFINGWERENLVEFFSKVRNPFGHGAGSDPVPELSVPQTDWAIEFCMIWTKNLIRRL